MTQEQKIKGLVGWTESLDCPDSFDDSFISEMADWFMEKGMFTPGQDRALDNIIERFEIIPSAYL